MINLKKWVGGFIILSIFSGNAHALEKCEIPLYYLDEATLEQSKNNLLEARGYFAIGFDVGQLLMNECGSNFSDRFNLYLKEYEQNIKSLSHETN